MHGLSLRQIPASCQSCIVSAARGCRRTGRAWSLLTDATTANAMPSCDASACSRLVRAASTLSPHQRRSTSCELRQPARPVRQESREDLSWMVRTREADVEHGQLRRERVQSGRGERKPTATLEQRQMAQSRAL